MTRAPPPSLVTVDPVTRQPRFYDFGVRDGISCVGCHDPAQGPVRPQLHLVRVGAGLGAAGRELRNGIGRAEQERANAELGRVGHG